MIDQTKAPPPVKPKKPKKGHPWRCHSEPARKMNQKGYIPHRSMMGLKV